MAKNWDDIYAEWEGACNAAVACEGFVYELTHEPGENDEELADAFINKALSLMSPEYREALTNEYDLNDKFSNDSLYNAFWELDDEQLTKMKWRMKS